ncbi:MAG: leucine-rich repeat domain-containing protein, partial [Muribaculaceae bacterium]|nr:leucine-rich repeat domain-containing protein [Muribaculaceae bacterium]
MSANAASVLIEGLTPIGAINFNRIYLVDNTSITVSSSAGTFNRVYIDGDQVAYKPITDWTEYSLNISAYLDGELHYLQLEGSIYAYGSCFFGNLAAIANSVKNVDGITYVLNDGTATVLGSTYTEIEEANILSTITTEEGGDYPVTSIYPYAFANLSKLRSVTIPNSVTSIGSDAFYNCSGLTEVIIPNSVTSIGSDAFYDCSGLKKSAYPNTINNPFPKGVSIEYNPDEASIEDGIIFGKNKASLLYASISLTSSYAIPETVTSIGSYAFENCSGLTEVIIPNSVTSIGS